MKYLKEKIRKPILELKKAIRGTTTIRSIVLLLLMFVGIMLAEYSLNICGLGFDYVRLISNSILLFLLFKFYLIFCSETNYSKKGVDIVDRYLQIKNKKHIIFGREMYLSLRECLSILFLECKQENNKHLKSIIREVAILFALVLLLSQKFTFGG